jgi:formamidopyrimidine-DNA glycosylase
MLLYPASAPSTDPLLSTSACLATQSFSAGVGNWVADEVLYQAAIHPEQPAHSIPAEQVCGGEEVAAALCATAACPCLPWPCHTHAFSSHVFLSDSISETCRPLRPQVAALHHAIRHVCQLACEVEADADKFPPTWLFHHR